MIIRTIWAAAGAFCLASLFSMASAADEPTSLTKVLPTLTPVSDYSGDFSDRYTLLGDFGGGRQRLYDKGIAFDASYTHVYQGVSSGGIDEDDYEHHGLLEYGVSLDTDKLGWWPGGLLVANFYASSGDTLLSDTGNIAPVNYNSTLPTSDPPETFPMEYYLTQALPTKTLVTIGRINAGNFLDRSKFSNDRKSQFLNAALDNNLLIGSFVSFSTYALLVVQPISEDFAVYGAVFDSALQPDEYQPDDGELFSDLGGGFGADIKWDLGDGLGGSINPVFIYSNKDTAEVDNPYYPLGPPTNLVIPINAPEESDNWAVIVTIDQYLWKPDSPKRASAVDTKADKSLPNPAADYSFQGIGLGLTIRGGYAPEEGNPWNSFFTVSLGGRGLIPGRPYDRLGVGAYRMFLSDDWEDLVLIGDILDDEVGAEAFYNFAITPALTVSLDVQWIDPGLQSTDETVVLGSRVFVRF